MGINQAGRDKLGGNRCRRQVQTLGPLACLVIKSRQHVRFNQHSAQANLLSWAEQQLHRIEQE